METFSALLAIWAGNSKVSGEFPAQRPVTRSFDVFFDQRLNEQFSKESGDWWFEMPSHTLWRHSNVDMSLKITHLKLKLHLQGTNELKVQMQSKWFNNKINEH